MVRDLVKAYNKELQRKCSVTEIGDLVLTELPRRILVSKFDSGNKIKNHKIKFWGPFEEFTKIMSHKNFQFYGMTTPPPPHN